MKSAEDMIRDAIRTAVAIEREGCALLAERLAAARREKEAERGFGPGTATPAANAYWCEEIADAIRNRKSEEQ